MEKDESQRSQRSRFRFFDLLSVVVAISALTMWNLKSGIGKKESKSEQVKSNNMKHEKRVRNLNTKSEGSARREAADQKGIPREKNISPPEEGAIKNKQASVGEVMQPLSRHFDFPGIEFFESAGTELTEAGRSALRNFAAEAGKLEAIGAIEISTFTDDRPVTPHRHRFRTNAELAALRAIAIQSFLEEYGFGSVPMKLVSRADKETRVIDLRDKQPSVDLAGQRSAAITLVRKGQLGDGYSPIAASRIPTEAN